MRFTLFIGTFGLSAESFLTLRLDQSRARLFSLLISTFSLLIAFFQLFPTWNLRYRTFYYLPFGIIASVSFLVSCIFGASFLIMYVVTRFFTDGCFQAHRHVVFGNSLPLALRTNFETLSIDLGCFPLNVQYFSTAVGLEEILFEVYSQFAPVRYTLTCPYRDRALPPPFSPRHCFNSFRRKQAITEFA